VSSNAKNLRVTVNPSTRIAIDLGSSSVRVAAFNNDAQYEPDTIHRETLVVHSKENSASEIDPTELLNKTCSTFLSCIQNTQISIDQPVLIGISAFWHSLLGVDEHFNPVTPVIMWNDSRGAKYLNELKNDPVFDGYTERTGCFLHSTYWPSKLLHLKQEKPDLFNRVSKWISPGEWIQLKLFGQLIPSVSMASATGLFNREKQDWDSSLLDLLGIGRESLLILNEPITLDTTPCTILKNPILTPVLGDGAASTIGSIGFDKNDIAVNLGTSAAIRYMAKSSTKTIPSMFSYAATPGYELVGGATNNCGNFMRWCCEKKGLNLEELGSVLGDYESIDDNLIVLPYLYGERSPFWKDNLNFFCSVDTESIEPDRFVRACFDAIGIGLLNILELIPEYSKRKIVVSGGMAESEELIQRLANIFQLPIYVQRNKEASLRGAMISASIYVNRNIEIIANEYERIDPDLNLSSAYRNLQEKMRFLHHKTFQ